MSEQIERIVSMQSAYMDKDGKLHVYDNGAMAKNVFFSDGKTFQQKLDAGELTGLVGATGATGETGATGAPGQDGADGTDGQDGKDGKTCATFVIGTSTAGWTADDCDYLCDGTNDEVEINAAIAALPDVGGTLFFRRGSYLVNGHVTVKSNVAFEGEGKSATILWIFDGVVMQPTGTLAASDVTFRSLSLKGDIEDGDAGVFILKKLQEVTLIDCICRNMLMQNCSDGSMVGCSFWTRDDMVYALEIKDCMRMSVVGCFFDGDLGLSGGTGYCAISGNTMKPKSSYMCEIIGTANHNAVVGNVSNSGGPLISGTGAGNLSANNVYADSSES